MEQMINNVTADELIPSAPTCHKPMLADGEFLSQVVNNPKTCRTCKHALYANFIDEKYNTVKIDNWGRCNTIRSIPSIDYLNENKDKLTKKAYLIQSDEFKDEGFLFSDFYFKIDEFGCLLHNLKV